MRALSILLLATMVSVFLLAIPAATAVNAPVLIFGTIELPDGTPAETAFLTGVSLQTGETHSVQLDPADEAYLEPASYNISFQFPGEDPIEDGSIIRFTASQGDYVAVLDVPKNGDPTRIDIVLHPLFVQTGTITDASGDPVAGAAVTITNPLTSESVTVTTGADGSYEVKLGLEPGTDLATGTELDIKVVAEGVEVTQKVTVGEDASTWSVSQGIQIDIPDSDDDDDKDTPFPSALVVLALTLAGVAVLGVALRRR